MSIEMNSHATYLREYRTRPEVKKRTLGYFRTGVKSVADCFDHDKPVTVGELVARSHAGRGYVRIILNSFVKCGLVKKVGEMYMIDSANPLRFALDDYYRDRVKEEVNLNEF